MAKTVLITGIAGGLSQRVASLLLTKGYEVVGADYRDGPALPAHLSAVPVYRASYNKTAIEDVFRKYNFYAVLHLGRVGNLSEEIGKRFDLNVLGSQKLMNLCVSNKVSHLLVLSTFHIYGAHPLNPTPISEDMPLRAGYDFPQIADAIQLDNMATTWVWRHREVRTVVLRPTNVIGPTIHNTLAKFMRLPRVPYMAGFDPMTQFLHEDDLARAIVAGFEGNAFGVFNIAGCGEIPWRTALDIAETKSFPIPSSLSKLLVGTFSSFPGYLVNFYKYSCIITDDAFRKAFGWKPQVEITETIKTTVARARAKAAAAQLAKNRAARA